MSDDQNIEPVVERRVRSLELFFDLVFVLAFTQVTTKLSQDLTWHGLFRSLLVLAVLWWAWIGYAWLTNAFDPESKLLRLPIFLAMGAMLVCALAVPEAFGEYAAIFAGAYLIVRLIQVAMFLIGARDEPEVFKAFARLSPAFVIAPLLITASVFFDGTTQAVIWALAIAIDYGGPYLLVSEGFRVNAEHFSERFGLIVIIALGESIVSIGVGADGVELDTATITAAVLGMTLAAALWWMYFDYVAIAIASVLERLEGVERTKLARDSYSYLHYFLIAGIILAALGMKKTIGHPEEHLKEIPAVCLGLGVGLFAFTMGALRKRNVGNWNWFRVVVAAISVALIPVFRELPALASLAIITALLVITAAVEMIYYREARERFRSTA